ncbi:hypothetical protein QBC46DRAFT_344277 [Diplogelasinospora grovesii]|uniref:Zn(2)-C6 fungal-type domain-containing protein n=1 Tax=Diplogelasinospora grovesii TaxID=303347 RepID=A0AAN6S2T4_9PEZI|nr:hypothetical protein QBC46DRAFT_344277 [Diplogelasinospora grovesii]
MPRKQNKPRKASAARPSSGFTPINAATSSSVAGNIISDRPKVAYPAQLVDNMAENTPFAKKRSYQPSFPAEQPQAKKAKADEAETDEAETDEAKSDDDKYLIFPGAYRPLRENGRLPFPIPATGRPIRISPPDDNDDDVIEVESPTTLPTADAESDDDNMSMENNPDTSDTQLPEVASTEKPEPSVLPLALPRTPVNDDDDAESCIWVATPGTPESVDYHGDNSDMDYEDRPVKKSKTKSKSKTKTKNKNKTKGKAKADTKMPFKVTKTSKMATAKAKKAKKIDEPKAEGSSPPMGTSHVVKPAPQGHITTGSLPVSPKPTPQGSPKTARPRTCDRCRKAHSKCVFVLSCARCTKSGVDCSLAQEGADTTKSCDRCRKVHSFCTRQESCIRCQKAGGACTFTN